MAEKLRVIATAPIIRREGNVLLKVSGLAFEKDPGKIYVLPRTPFWMQLIKDGALKEVTEIPRKPGPQPKPKAQDGEKIEQGEKVE